MLPASRQLLLDGFLGAAGDAGYLGHGVALHVVQQYGRPFFGREQVEGFVEMVVFECAVGALARGHAGGFGQRLGEGAAPAVADECVAGYAVDPRCEAALLAEAVAGQICLDECLLGQVVGKGAVTAAESGQKAPELSLIALYVLYESSAVHHPGLFRALVVVVSNVFPGDEVHHQIGYAYGETESGHYERRLIVDVEVGCGVGGDG